MRVGESASPGVQDRALLGREINGEALRGVIERPPPGDGEQRRAPAREAVHAAHFLDGGGNLSPELGIPQPGANTLDPPPLPVSNTKNVLDINNYMNIILFSQMTSGSYRTRLWRTVQSPLMSCRCFPSGEKTATLLLQYLGHIVTLGLRNVVIYHITRHQQTQLHLTPQLPMLAGRSGPHHFQE